MLEREPMVARGSRRTMPLLEGELAERARVALDDIGDRFLRASRRTSLHRDASLSSGLGGAALLHHRLEQLRPRRGHRACAGALLDAAIEGAPSLQARSLHSGVVGIGWLLDHVQS